MPDRMRGKVALVTGAGSGIGRATALLLAAEGATVIVSEIDETRGEQTVAAIRDAGGRGRFVRHDVSREADWQSVLGGIRDEEEQLDVLVNNAGIAWAGSVLDMSLEDFRRQNAVNLDGVFLGTRHAIPMLRDAGGGSIVNISSVAGIRGAARLAGYCASKGGVRLFTKAVALESIREGWNVRVNSIHPGVIDTAIWRTVTPADLLDAGANEINLEAIAAAAGGRPGRPEEVAAGVLFLASDESSYVNGTELVIDAGGSA